MTGEPFVFPTHWRWPDRPPLAGADAFAGHVVAVLYWRVGCPHSRAALVEFAQTAREFVGRPVAFVAVCVASGAGEGDGPRRRLLARLPAPLTCAVTDRGDEVDRLPTLRLLDEQGLERAHAFGVPRSVRVGEAVRGLLRVAEASGRAAMVPLLPCARDGDDRLDPVALAHDGERLWVASGRRRQVFAFGVDGRLSRTVGSGRPGDDDGAADVASFALPAALAVCDDKIVLADCGSHTLRAIDRTSGEVDTWCGNGQLGCDSVGGGYGRDQALSSPAGLVACEGGLYVCHAGTDQLWQVDPITGAAMAWLGDEAGGSFAAPVAIAAREQALWVAEERSGRVAKVDLAHAVRRDVPGRFVRPVALAVAGERVFVADVGAGGVFELCEGGGWRPLLTAEHGVREPVALAVGGGRLFVADAAADAILTVALDSTTSQAVALALGDLPPPPARDDVGATTTRRLQLLEHADVTLRIPIASVEAGATVEVDVVDEGPPLLAASRHEVVAARLGMVQVLLPVVGPGEGTLRIRVRAAGLTRFFVAPVAVTADGVDAAELRPAFD